MTLKAATVPVSECGDNITAVGLKATLSPTRRWVATVQAKARSGAHSSFQLQQWAVRRLWAWRKRTITAIRYKVEHFEHDLAAQRLARIFHLASNSASRSWARPVLSLSLPTM